MGHAGSKATFACDVKAVGVPDEFDYTTATSAVNAQLDNAQLGKVVLG